jgi:serine/threonine protein phosphatase PrpC
MLRFRLPRWGTEDANRGNLRNGNKDIRDIALPTIAEIESSPLERSLEPPNRKDSNAIIASTNDAIHASISPFEVIENMKGKLHEIIILPSDIYAAGGDEDREDQGSFKKGNFFAVTDRGIEYYFNYPKKKNDDGYLIMSEAGIAAVVDGVGSMPLSERASTIAINMIMKEFDLKEKGDLKKILQKIHKYIGKINITGDLMAATIVITRLNSDNMLEFVHAGDSRGIVIRNGEIVFSTRDDNLLTAYMEKEQITVEEAQKRLDDRTFRDRRCRITQGIGINRKEQQQINANYRQFQAYKGDIVILCSDGLTDNYTNDEIAEFINARKGKSLAEIIKELKSQSIEKMKTADGNADNITIVAFTIE